MSVKSKTENSLQAKIVVLGDPGTGKSSLIRALDPQCRNISQNVSNGSDMGTTSFTVIEIPPDDLDGSAVSVFLKFWEFKGTGLQEEQIAFPGALFCFVTLDMRAPETANSAFNKWVAIKEAQMPEAFLFVIGTFLDDPAQRRIEVADVCKACAQKEGIYIEVSNLEGNNILLLRRLICQRLNHMLNIREELRKPGRDLSSGISIAGDDDPHSIEEGKMGGDSSFSVARSHNITPSLLDQNILCNSVGNILSSALAVEQWQGFEREQEHLVDVGNKISSFIDELSDGISDAPPPPDPSRHGTLAGGDLHTALTEPDADEVRHLFNIMGLSLPQSLQFSLSNGYVPPKSVSVKVKVRLPDDNFSYLILKSGDDVESVVMSFAATHNMTNNNGAISKLIEVGTSMLKHAIREQENEGSNPHDAKQKSLSPTKSPSRKPLKCKARIQLPDTQTIVTTITEGEDARSVAQRIASEHGLSLGYQHKIWEQLQNALDSLDRSRYKSAL